MSPLAHASQQGWPDYVDVYVSTIHIRCAKHEKGLYAVCGQRWPWSACASEPSLFAYRINGNCSICRRTENAQIKLRGCACCSGPSLFTYDIRPLFPCRASYGIFFFFFFLFLLFINEPYKKKMSSWCIWIVKAMINQCIPHPDQCFHYRYIR